jgi:hypothetical protein
MSRTPAKAFHSLLRTKFAPFVPQWGGDQMTLNSIYSLTFAVKSPKKSDGGVDGNGKLHSSIAEALWRLHTSSNNNKEEIVDCIYTVVIKNEPNLRLLSCNTLKHHHKQTPNSDSNLEVYTLLSSPEFGKQFKGPQENLPPELTSKVIMKLLGSLARSLGVAEESIVDSIVDLKLQLWGAAVPMNMWSSKTLTSKAERSGDIDGFVYDSFHGVGACGDWILDSSIAGAWESGRRLANWMLVSSYDADLENGPIMSVGLPDRSSKDVTGKFVPSRAAESGIGTIPSYSPGDQSTRGTRGPSRTTPSPRRRNGSNSSGNDRREGNNGRGSIKPRSR